MNVDFDICERKENEESKYSLKIFYRVENNFCKLKAKEVNYYEFIMIFENG